MVILFSLFLISLLAIPLFYRSDLANADSMTWPLLWKDLLGDGYSWNTWKLPPSPAFFSEGLPYLGLYPLSKDFHLNIAIVSGLQAIALFGAGLSFLSGAKQLSTKNILILAFVISLGLLGTSYRAYALWAAMNNMHMGALIASIGAAGILLKQIKTPRTINYLMLATICWLGTLDGRLFVITFSLPACVFLATRGFRPNVKNMSALLIGTFFGVKTLPILSRWDGLSDYETKTPLESARIFWDSILQVLFKLDWSARAVSMLCLLGFGTLTIKTMRNIRTPQSARPADLLALLMILSNTLGVLLSGKFHHPLLEFRYMLVAVFLLILVALLTLGQFINVKIIFLSLLGLAIATIRDLPKERSPSKYELITDCLHLQKKTFQLKHGLSGYWTSKPLSLLTKDTLRVRPLTPGAQGPFHWMSNQEWFPQSSEDLNKTAYTFNFVVLDDLVTHEAILEKIGPAKAKFICPENDPTKPPLAEVWVYDETRMKHWLQKFVR